MGIAGRLFRFFVFSNLFIATCAVLMAWQTMFLFALVTDYNLLGFIFFATICSYSFHWMLSTDLGSPGKRSDWMLTNGALHRWFFLTGAAGSVVFGYKLASHWGWLVSIAFITFLYSAPKIPHPLSRHLRKIAIGKTLFLSIVWTIVTTLLPLVIGRDAWNTQAIIFLVNRFFLIYAICILFDLRDLEYDRRVGIKSLITWLSASQVRALFYLSILLHIISGVLLLAFGQSILSVAILLVSGFFTAALYRKAITDFSDFLYYFVLDGLMALSAGIFFILHLTSP